MRLLFVADRIPLELRAIVEFLNQQMRQTGVYAVELARHRGDSDLRVSRPPHPRGGRHGGGKRRLLVNGSRSPDAGASENERERNELARSQLFVAMTRARDVLWLGGVCASSQRGDDGQDLGSSSRTLNPGAIQRRAPGDHVAAVCVEVKDFCCRSGDGLGWLWREGSRTWTCIRHISWGRPRACSSTDALFTICCLLITFGKSVMSGVRPGTFESRVRP